MTDTISFPPLRDLPPGRLEARKRHVLSEIGRAPERIAPLRARIAVPAAAALGVAAVCAVVFSGALGSSGTHRASNERLNVWPAQGTPQQFSAIELDVTRSAGSISSLGVTVQAATLGGTAELEVVRGHMEGSVPSTTGQVVYRGQIPMTNIASPQAGSPGTVPLSAGSTALLPSAWEGGCQKAPYWIMVKVSPAHPTEEAHGESAQSGWFRCSR